MLKKFYPGAYSQSVFDIDYKKLYQNGVRGLIFDIDNTLVHHGDDSNDKVDNFFKELHKTGFKTILLSNNDKERIERFIQNIDTQYVCDANKPAVDGYLKAVELLELDKNKVIFIGDQMFVDIYGANKCSIPNIMVHFIEAPDEKKIGIKRYLEKLVLIFYKLSKSNSIDIWKT